MFLTSRTDYPKIIATNMATDCYVILIRTVIMAFSQPSNYDVTVLYSDVLYSFVQMLQWCYSLASIQQ